MSLRKCRKTEEIKQTMIAKVCPDCEKRSYSSSSRGGWECPYCGKEVIKDNREDE